MYRIIVTPNYFLDALNTPQQGFVEDEKFDIREWETKEEAQDWIDEMESGTYYLSHNEAGPPTYEIVNENYTLENDCYDASSIMSQECKYGILVKPEDVPANIKTILDEANVEYASSGDDYDVFIYTEQGYTIVYCPKSLAIQINRDDLGGICWANEAYYYNKD